MILRLAAEVSQVHVSDRKIDVPEHGSTIVVWTTKHPPTATAISADGTRLGEISLVDPA
jgi:hypothetical protein